MTEHSFLSSLACYFASEIEGEMVYIGLVFSRDRYLHKQRN